MRPFGAAFGDLLNKGKARSDLDLEVLQVPMVILALFFVFFVIEMYNLFKAKEILKAEKKSHSQESMPVHEEQGRVF